MQPQTLSHNLPNTHQPNWGGGAPLVVPALKSRRKARGKHRSSMFPAGYQCQEGYATQQHAEQQYHFLQQAPHDELKDSKFRFAMPPYSSSHHVL